MLCLCTSTNKICCSEGEQNRTGGGAGQHTIQANKTLPIAGAMSSGGRGPAQSGALRAADHTDLDPKNCASGRTNVNDATSTLDTPAAAANTTVSGIPRTLSPLKSQKQGLPPCIPFGQNRIAFCVFFIL